MLNFYS